MTVALLVSSITQKVDHYGALAGVAAIVGIGVLAVLYAAQAREVKRLREWAGRGPERDADLQQRVAADAQRRAVVPRPATVPVAPAPVVTQPATVAGVAGVANPAAAQPGVPIPGPATATAVTAAAAGASPLKAATAQGGVPAAAATATAGAGPGPGPGPSGAPAPAVASTPGSSAPASSAPPGQATPTPPAAPAVPARPAASAQHPMVVPPAVPAGTGQPRPRAAAAPLRPTAREAAAVAPPEPARRNLLVVLFGGLAIIAITALLITQVFSGGGTTTKRKPNRVSSSSSQNSGPGAGGTAGLPPINRKVTTVAALNGTAVQGLARAALNKLVTRGYLGGAVATYPQPVAATTIYYARGSNRQARDAARILGLAATTAKPMDPAIAAAAGNATVVVVVGADQAR